MHYRRPRHLESSQWRNCAPQRRRIGVSPSSRRPGEQANSGGERAADCRVDPPQTWPQCGRARPPRAGVAEITNCCPGRADAARKSRRRRSRGPRAQHAMRSPVPVRRRSRRKNPAGDRVLEKRYVAVVNHTLRALKLSSISGPEHSRASSASARSPALSTAAPTASRRTASLPGECSIVYTPPTHHNRQAYREIALDRVPHQLHPERDHRHVDDHAAGRFADSTSGYQAPRTLGFLPSLLTFLPGTMPWIVHGADHQRHHGVAGMPRSVRGRNGPAPRHCVLASGAATPRGAGCRTRRSLAKLFSSA